MRNSKLLKMWMNLEKLVQRSPTSSHRCIPIVTQRRALQTRILKMENYEKCWPKTSRIPTASRKQKAVMIQERRASTKRTQVDHSRKTSLTSSSSQELRACDAMFSSGSKEPGNQMKRSIFKNADPSNLGWSLREGNKDHLLSQARWVRNIKLNKTCAQRLELQDAQHGYIESRREQVRLQEELSTKEKVLRDTEIRSVHVMGEMKRAQELRVDDVSVRKLRENHETIQQLTSQLQEMQEQMNSKSDSGEFQEVASNYRGRLSYVSSQPAMIPSSRSMLSRDKRLPLDTWNTSGLQGNVFW